ncbi:MAG TPA: transglutaminase-like domain-containing protein, partial [Candidatus Nanoarchaeia archaeon]|nr:transglutaminase-like domain-containing protein [Candidatus Nanoarchaeia archaeon]
LMPTTFSWNYELLKVATHALETARWQPARPLMYYSGIIEDDNLFVSSKKDLIDLITANYDYYSIDDLAELIQQKLNRFNIFDINLNTKANEYPMSCNLFRYSDTGLQLACPVDYCDINQFDFSLTSSSTENAYKRQFIVDNELCVEDVADSNSGLSTTDVYGAPCERVSDTVRRYPGNKILDCNTQASNCQESSGVITCNLGDCAQYSNYQVLNCGDGKRQCFLDLNTTGDTMGKCSMSGNIVTCGTYRIDYSTSTPTVTQTVPGVGTRNCKVLYNTETCDLICDNSLPPNENYKVYNLNEHYVVSPYASFEFQAIYNFEIVRIYTSLNNNKYSILVRPIGDALMPASARIVEKQEGIRGYQISLNIFDQTWNNGNSSIGEYEHNFQGEVTIPYYFENATMNLFNCLKGDYCSDNSVESFWYYTKVDNYLVSYPYITNLDKTTLKKRIALENRTYEYRDGKDLTNFYCDKGPYNGCEYEPAKYAYDTCHPAWATLKTGKGRCEDFALLDYSLFKALGIPETRTDDNPNELSVSLKMSYCTLPCACKKLFNQCNIAYNQTACAGPQYVTVEPATVFGAINSCNPDIIRDYPDISGSKYEAVIGGDKFTILQSFTSGPHYYPVYLNKRFSEELDFYTFDETSFLANYASAGNKIPVNDNEDLCAKYSVTDFNQMVTECANYIDDANFITKINAECAQ